MALFASLAVWFDAAALSLGDPLGRVSRDPPTLFKASSQGPCGTDASSYRPHKEGPSHGGQAFITPFFNSFFFGSERCVCSTAPVSPQRSRFHRASPSDSGAEVAAFKDGLGSEFKDLSARAPYLLPPDGLFIPHFLAHGGVEVCSLYGHFLRPLCHTHRSNLPIGAIKR